MSTPAPRLPLSRRTTVGAAAWSAPVVAVAAAAPAIAASAATLQRVDPTDASFGIGSDSRAVRARRVNGTIAVVGATVTFALSDASFVTFSGGSTTTTAVTDADGIAAVTLVPVTGATPQLGSVTTLTATSQDSSVVWTVTYARVDSLSTGGTAFHRVLLSNGVLHAFGDNLYGQLGDGSSTARTVPVPVAQTGTSIAGKTITTVAVGRYHSVALASDGTVHTWGHNIHGQLGNGTTTDSSVPVQVSTAGTPMAGKTITAVAAGFHHSVALASDGTVHSWGFNSSGQLGNGRTTSSSVPVQLVTTFPSPLAGRRVTGVAAGLAHTVALVSDGTVVAWGANGNGQLGDGTIGSSSTPVRVRTAGTPMAGRTIAAVAAGGAHTVALAADSTVHTWGNNGDGQLGDGTTTTESSVPVLVSTAGTPMAGKTITAVAAGGAHTVALASDSTLHAWGSNQLGQLGDGTTTDSPVPTPVTTTGTPMAGKPITTVTAGSGQSYSVSSDRLGFSWGSCFFGELGNGTGSQSTVPTQIAAVPAGQAARVTRRNPPRAALPQGD